MQGAAFWRAGPFRIPADWAQLLAIPLANLRGGATCNPGARASLPLIPLPPCYLYQRLQAAPGNAYHFSKLAHYAAAVAEQL